MTIDNTKQNPTGEVEPMNETELGEEMLGDINGGVGIGPFSDLIPPTMPEKPKENNDGGSTTTGSW